MRPIRIAALGGSLRSGSVSTAALRYCAARAHRAGAEVTALVGPELALPPYDPETRTPSAAERRLLAALSAADGVLLSSPTYHGGMSGLLKNALDHTEGLATNGYLDGRSVGCVSVAWNEVAGASALTSLRASAQALRGWAVPMGVVVRADTEFTPDDMCTDPRTARRLDIVTDQVLEFAGMRRGGRDTAVEVVTAIGAAL
ncbi:NADPH-dependent FMN reductase [Streptomyces yaanensis]|uniref:NADPH-dependent FMN reductase n=1 Tax=Streptomyces yaanensis TaxID=1142239 RepID=A0ABV7SEP7_9ACTN|nr:NAD(P)H-dependent oxidoreductase [Streptomyces sp. CGMCC 4.7035]WNB99317.1 NAD(P)H-dependent oxidoreductase [Streptomyces sp. CGMCC 4.7035]